MVTDDDDHKNHMTTDNKNHPVNNNISSSNSSPTVTTITPSTPTISSSSSSKSTSASTSPSTLQLLGIDNPIINMYYLDVNANSTNTAIYTKWTEEEDELLKAAINIYGPHKWSLIAAHVPNRTPMQCSTRWLGALNPTIHKGRWTPEEDSLLKEAVGEYLNLLDSDGHPQPIPWNKIAQRIPHRTGIQCQARWSEALDPSVRKGKWSPDEDEILKDGVRRYGRCWIRIAELIDGRTQVYI
ncbi:5627_t:CDS:2 [Entrophospora sp. SA101]|nr:5627_t:CDS:2 [Entrophospora sp. SA101]